MREPTELLELASIIKRNRGILVSIHGSLESALDDVIPRIGRTSTSALIPAGLLENYYTCLETIMLRISQHFDNNLAAVRWHADLLDRMRIQIEGVRVPLVDDQTYARLTELLKFRHFRRYYFEMEYDWDRIDYLVGVLRKTHSAVLEGIDRFLAFLSALG